MHSEQKEQLLLSLVDTVSDAQETPMEELPPLNDSIDLDALNGLVTDDQSSDVAVSFEYDGLRVLVRSRETVYARPIREDGSEPVDILPH